MRPMRDDLVVLTATANPVGCLPRLQRWLDQAALDYRLVVVVNGRAGNVPGCMTDYEGPIAVHGHNGYLGVVPAFAAGMEFAFQLTPPPTVIACLHDDVEIDEDSWDDRVMDTFETYPACGLTGFGGGKGLGASNIYQVDYDPMHLARTSFVSNMREAEAHGRRLRWRHERLACLDGFSQIGRVEYWRARAARSDLQSRGLLQGVPDPEPEVIADNLFQQMETLGIIHHAYDAALGCYAKRLGWEVWLTPVECHHLGGQTAVADQGYAAWADAKTDTDHGDHVFWNQAHRLVYDEFKDVLPIAEIR